MTAADTADHEATDHAVTELLEAGGEMTVGDIIHRTGKRDIFHHLRSMQARGHILFSGIAGDPEDTLVRLPR